MSNIQFIEHIFTPTRLLLAWQAPGGGRLFSVGELLNRDGIIKFRYLSDSDDFRMAVEQGFSIYPAFPICESEYSEDVMAAFMRRLPPRSRGDYSKYLEQWRLRNDACLSDFALLAYSGAKLPSDGFSVVWPLEEVTAPGEILLEVAGFRYQGVGLNELSVGMSAAFVPEPENESDDKALRIEVGGKRIGYVKRAQRDVVMKWLSDYDLNISLERFNGTDDRPVVYIFCRLSER